MHLIILGIIFSFLGHLFSPGMAVAETCKEWVAKATSVKGRVEVRRAGQTHWADVQRHDAFCPGDVIRVMERANLAIVAQNETNHRLDENTIITIAESEQKQTFLLNLRQGAAYFFSRLPRSLKVITPFVNAGVEGTEFFVRVERDQTFLSVFEGQVAATSPEGSLILRSGQSAVVKVGQVPERRVVVRPRDAVQWALYYPPILDLRPLDSPVRTVGEAVVRQSLQAYLDGNLPTALDSMMSAPQGIAEPNFFTYRAALLLTVGRIDAARMDLDVALKLDPGNSRAFALQSIISMTQDKKDDALELARKAVKLEPGSSVARVALSYAQQAHFDLQGALASLKEAVTLPPENALTWARLAELQLSVGDLKKALEAAQRAVVLNPQVARTQTVLGFAFLTQIKVQKAKTAFEQAIQLDQTAPLPRLGLGLAQIRRGKLKEGRREIEIAASLDPNNSLMRSYLGKAYFEENRDKLARDQFVTAKELDPQDPTPWFYDAIRKQTVNRPVEALHDLQKSIELNDNRAVYRSHLLLDEDLAARSTSLGRIYSDLGFQQLALVEGWRSLESDPSNYSAHRFLADLYAALPRHEIARVSELLQSQLLQPTNLTPVQPQLAESNLFILEGTGPANPAFNEFSPLFYRNRFALQASGVAGENSTLGDELVQSGVWDRLSYSVGQFHFETDGFRDNNDLQQDIYNVFVQARLAYNLSIQAEFRRAERESGDIKQQFNLNAFSRALRKTIDRDTLRLGLHYAPAVHSDFITSLIFHDRNESDRRSFTDPITSLDIASATEQDEKGFNAEAQYLFRTKQWNLIVGAGHVGIDSTFTDATKATDGPVVILDDSSRTQSDIRHTNVYVYSHIRLPAHMTLTLGASGDFFDDEKAFDRQQFNPKFGFTWRPTLLTTIRLAAFRVLKRLLVSNQTIEPTQVAGFNQFFDENNGTESERYGVAIDQKFSLTLFGGIELSKRDLDVPILNALERTLIRKENQDELRHRAYLYWTPTAHLALRAEYQFEEIERDFAPGITDVGADLLSKIQTHRVPLSFNAYHTNGLFLKLQATYIDQEVRFLDPTRGTDDDQFWVMDVAMGYRLPKGWGIFSLTVQNLFDEQFNFQETGVLGELRPPSLQPERAIFTRLTLSF